ncbi:DMT family transporter [Bacillus sp. 03113]|uniref:DMT family transporter n=1 Tax=Bacillus sp. 03113 TaxID=2578211 RepID=UPI001143EF6B|nr:DMT family transporter [Bacillus sp. 03113]
MKKTFLADLSLLLVALCWGATFVMVQKAVSILDPITFNAIRFTLAFAFLILWLFLFERKLLRTLNWKLCLSGMMMGLWLFIGYAFQTIGLLYTTSANAGFITGLSVVLVPLFAALFLKHKPSINSIIGVFIATFGLHFLTMKNSTQLNTGDGLVFFCAISFAIQIILTSKYSKHYSTLLLTIIQIGTAALFSSFYALLFEDWHQIFRKNVIFDKSVIVALFITAIFATALAFIAQTNFQKFTTPTRVALIFSMEPVFAAITAYFWNDEQLSSSAFIGCLFIFTGMIFSELPIKKTFLSVKKGKAV